MDTSITLAVKAMTVFLLITSILVVIARVITKAVIVRSTNLDDYLIALSFLFNIGQSVAVFFQAEHGYGMPSKLLSPSSLSSELKSEYTAALLYIPSLLFAKLAVLALVKTITPNRWDRRAAYSVAALVVLWATTGEFAAAFMCHVPNTWEWPHGQCNDRHAFWNYLEVTNILTDTALIALPLIMISRIRTSLATKASVFSFFGLRIIVIAACVCKLVFWNRTSDPTDPTLDTWPATICTQIIQSLSISSACFLYLKPFLDSVQSGFIRSDDLRRRGSDYKSGSTSTARNVFSVDSVSRSKVIGTRLQSLSKTHYAADIKGGHAANRDDSESQHSRTQIIKETRTFAVETFPDVHDTSPYRSNDV
ncbi:hypothetical protein HO133_008000 [Letharia lupina]|uniref:Rhodopsin domain-containing protein n=1 Tax=Letharia lupina TaxID=560253 RepID=A0A8H6CQZ7_9LECA|nr:uncharacterized protein HO133_008000 [Letharia lupina]KAF6228270.1 hypothetical protein HO133_008000 [Letharia lupina]